MSLNIHLTPLLDLRFGPDPSAYATAVVIQNIFYSLANERAVTRFQNGFFVVNVLLLLHVHDMLFLQFFHSVRSVLVELQTHQIHPAETAHADCGDRLEVG